MKNLSILLALFAVACGTQKENNVLKIGLNAEYAPYEYMEGNKFTGLNVEVVEQVLSNAGIKYEFVNMSFDGLISALQTGKADLLIGVGVTEDRKQIVDFTDPYRVTQSLESILIHKDSEGTLDLNDLEGKEFGVQIGTMQEQLANQLKVKVVPYNSPTAALLALNGKKIEGVITTDEYLPANPDLRLLGKLPAVAVGYTGFAVPKGKQELIDKLNIEIAKLKNSGEIARLEEKYQVLD